MSGTYYHLTITGMNCPECVDKVKRALQGVPGVEEVAVDTARKMATIGVNGSHVTSLDLVAAVVNAGYGAKVA